MRILEIVTFTCFATFASASVMPPPANDNCATPVVLAAPGIFAFDTTMATTSAGITAGICPTRGGDIWYAWTATAVGLATFSTCGQTDFDTNIAVFSNGPCPTGAPLMCDDDSCGNSESTVSWTTTVGVTYRLQLGRSGMGAGGGTGTFTLAFSGPPANDACASPIVLASGGVSPSYDNTTATTGTQGQANPSCSNPKKDLWYTWTARQNGSATMDTCGQTSQNTTIAVYLGAGCPAAVALACNNDSCSIQSSVTWSITAGTVYTLQIGGTVSDPGGPGSFTIIETGTSTGAVFCQGDGAHTACPCANNSVPTAGAGCLNSMAVGGRLRGSGSASVANDSFLLTATQVPNGPGVFSQGTAQAAAGGNGVVLGDGLLCLGGTLVRMGIVFTSSNTSTFPSGAFPSISVIGGVAAGNTRYYQLWYRDSAVAFCPPATNNLTNGVSLTWAP